MSFRFFNFNLLIEDRKTVHTECVNNNNKHVFELVVGDIVMARTTIKRDTSTSEVAKLSYQAREPFRIVK